MDPLTYLLGLEKLGIKFGLANIETITSALGDPERAWRSVIIAGTNGKGSVTAMVDASLRAAGLRTGRYTSPHLVRLEERIAVDGVPVSTEMLADTASDVRETVARLREGGRLDTEPTFFEATTAIAFEIFRRASVELAVLEVGMGGRFDATNVAAPLAAAITTIDLDHQQFLGGTIREIAYEKAGVIKPGRPVVVGERKPEALEVIRRVSDEQGATLIDAQDGVRVDARGFDDGCVVLQIETPQACYGPLKLGLRGRHQVLNAIVAVRLLEAIEPSGVRVGRDAIEQGLRDVSWRGRLDVVPIGENRRLLLDSAHNPAGAAVLAAYLAEVHPRGLPLVMAAMADKDVPGMLAHLLPHATRFVATQPQMPRAMAPERLAELAARQRALPIAIERDPWTAVERALADAPVACVTGTIFLVGAVVARIGP
jgi:dihydrofolate synthase/folylpolyglutamate synthase